MFLTSHVDLFYFIKQEIARHLRPTTLRALYGRDKVKNAIHCTDLPEDGVLEVGGTPLKHTLYSACTVENSHIISCVAPLIPQTGFLVVFQSMHKQLPFILAQNKNPSTV